LPIPLSRVIEATVVVKSRGIDAGKNHHRQWTRLERSELYEHHGVIGGPNIKIVGVVDPLRELVLHEIERTGSH
jgi:hypothetical protein